MEHAQVGAWARQQLAFGQFAPVNVQLCLFGIWQGLGMFSNGLAFSSRWKPVGRQLKEKSHQLEFVRAALLWALNHISVTDQSRCMFFSAQVLGGF